MWQRSIKWANAVEKTLPIDWLIDWLDTGLPQTFNLWKKKKNNKTHTHTHTQSVKCNKVKPSRMKCAWTNFKNSGGNIWRCLAPPKTSLICKFSCLLNLPPTNLEVATSFFGFSLSSMERGCFQISARKFTRFWTNSVQECWILDFIQLNKSEYYYT